MQLNIRGTVSEALNQHVTSSLEAALGQHESRIDSVSVTLEDVNGPKGGVDQLCKLDVKLERGKRVLIEETARDMYASISQAAERAKQAVGRIVGRQKDKR